MRHLGKVTFALVLAASTIGCGMYDMRAQRLKTPEPIKPKAGLEKDPVVVITDAPCELRQGAMPVPKPSPRTAEAERTGDARKDVFVKTADPEVKKDALIDVIDSYGRALASDPFNPTLTLKLAEAYDKAQRKDCALALLGRLAKLSDNPKYEKRTTPTIDEVVDRKSLFERYRNEAIRAVGR